MLRELKFRGEVIFSAAAFALLLLSLAVMGCGGDGGQEAVVERGATESGAATEVSLPPPIEPPVAVMEPIEVATVEESEPKEVTYEEAEAAFLDRRYDEAVELFTRYTERRPSNPWGFYMLGLSAWKSNEPESAETAFEAALELDPQHVKSWLNFARVLLDTDRPEEALDKIDEALILDSQSGVALRLKGRAYHQLGRLEDAIDAYRQAILIDDRDVWSMNNFGLILIEQERFMDALRPLARAAELEGEVAIFQNNLGIALERTGHYRAAAEAYRTAFAFDESHEKAQGNLARVDGLEEKSDLDPVDLGALARSFVEEVEGWREAIALQVTIEEVVADTVIEKSSADSVSVQGAQGDETGPPTVEPPEKTTSSQKGF